MISRKFLEYTTALTLAATAVASCSAEPKSALSEKEIEAIVKAYIEENPEVIVASVERYYEQQQQAERVQMEEERKRVESEAASHLPDILAQADQLPTVGPADASITVVEFYDYNCGFCRRATDWVAASLEDDDKDFRFIFVDLPIVRPDISEHSARASIAAVKQDKFWELHYALMKSPGNIDAPQVFAAAEQVGIDVDQLKKDMASDETTERLKKNEAIQAKIGFNGTPAFFVNDTFVSGAQMQRLEQLVQEAS